MATFKASDFNGNWSGAKTAKCKSSSDLHRRHALDKEILAQRLNMITDKASLPEREFKALKKMVNDGTINMHSHLSAAQNVGLTASQRDRRRVPYTRSVSDKSSVGKIVLSTKTGTKAVLTSQEASHQLKGVHTLVLATGKYPEISELLDDLIAASIAQLDNAYVVDCKRHPDGSKVSLGERIEQDLLRKDGAHALSKTKAKVAQINKGVKIASSSSGPAKGKSSRTFGPAKGRRSSGPAKGMSSRSSGPAKGKSSRLSGPAKGKRTTTSKPSDVAAMASSVASKARSRASTARGAPRGSSALSKRGTGRGIGRSSDLHTSRRIDRSDTSYRTIGRDISIFARVWADRSMLPHQGPSEAQRRQASAYVSSRAPTSDSFSRSIHTVVAPPTIPMMPATPVTTAPSFTSGAVVGYSARGHAMYTGPRGGTYHVSSGGNRVYH